MRSALRRDREPKVDQFVIETLRYGTPLVYVTMAGVLASRSGIWHLGLEGLMIVGCCASVLGVVQTESIAVGIGLAIVLCVIGSVLLWFVIEKLRANPIIAGLGLTGLGLGGTDLAVQSTTAARPRSTLPSACPALAPPSVPTACSRCWSCSCRSSSSRYGSSFGGRASACVLRRAASIPSRRGASVPSRRASG